MLVLLENQCCFNNNNTKPNQTNALDAHLDVVIFLEACLVAMAPLPASIKDDLLAKLFKHVSHALLV
jgi:hypothetical protein